MSLILAIESDKRQASRISAIARSLDRAELVIAESVTQALDTLASRVPDLILTPLLLSPKDSAALDDRLRELDASGRSVQTLMTPMLASVSTARKPTPKTGLLMRLRKTQRGSSPDGCEPDVFAAQIREYLDRGHEQRQMEHGKESFVDQRLLDETVVTAPGPEPAATIAAFTEDITAHPTAVSEPEQPLEIEVSEPVFANATTAFESESIVAAASIDVEPVTLPESSPQPFDAAAIFAERLADVSQPFDGTGEVVVAAREIVDEPVAPTWSTVPWPETPVPIPTDDPELAAEVAAILSTPSPSMTAGEEWVDVDMDLLAAHSLPAAAAETVVAAAPEPAVAAVAAPDESSAVAPTEAPAADDFDVSEFVRALEASLAADVPKKKRRKRAEIARKPEPVPEVQEDEPELSFDDYDPNADLWMPLPAAARAIWPQFDGGALAVVKPVKPAAAMPEPALAVVAREATRARRPAVITKVEPDEWGLFDPQQCGMAALLAQLDEVEDTSSE